MTTKLILAFALMFSGTLSCAASECGQQIQAIQRRMESAGASQVTGKPASPDAKSQASNAEGHAPAPTNQSQASSPEKMKKAQSLIDKAKTQDAAGDKDGCEKTMASAQATIGALP